MEVGQDTSHPHPYIEPKDQQMDVVVSHPQETDGNAETL
jgi:hypothetical protein